jgi:hypothetical protein
LKKKKLVEIINKSELKDIKETHLLEGNKEMGFIC